MDKQDRYLYEFGPFRVDPEERLLFRGEEPVPLPPKAFETLLILLNRSERVVLKDDLMKTSLAGHLCGGIQSSAEHLCSEEGLRRDRSGCALHRDRPRSWLPFRAENPAGPGADPRQKR